MKFGNFKRLGSANESAKFRLPNELEVDMSFVVPGQPEMTVKAHLETMPMGLPPHDAFFVVADKSLSAFKDKVNKATAIDPRYSTVRDFRPHKNSFLFSSHMETLSRLSMDAYKRWHEIALSQRHRAIPEMDPTAGIDVDPAVKARAEAWLRGARPWNAEQMNVIDTIHKVKGGLSLCSGIAGTGKTTLQIALAIYCVKLGGRALVTATANSNADHATISLNDWVHIFENMNIRVYRAYSASRKVSLKDMTRQQATERRVGHTNGYVSNLHSLRFTMMAEKKKLSALDFSLEQGVLDGADKGELHLKSKMNNPNGPLVDAWDTFRRHLKADRERKFNWADETSRKEYAACFETCRGHLVGLADIIVTTNGNVRCKEIEDHWAKSAIYYNKPVKALGIFIDEVGKEQEINIWNVLTADLPRKTPDFVFFFGDERQLSPVNTGEHKKFQFNQFHGRLSLSLFSRLLNEGFPHVHLTEQQRMHPSLSKFVNHEFYKGKLRNAPKVDRTLEEVKPGLAAVLHKIIAKSMASEDERKAFLKDATDEQVRLHYVEMPVCQVNKDDKHSIVVPGHISRFFKHILPELQEYFGERMEKEVLIIVGYGNAIKRYEQQVYMLRAQQKWPDSHYPRILTIDSAQGQEADMVIMDGSMRYRDRLGFMAERGRSNVAMTRAREVLWVLGGSLELADSRNALEPITPFVKLKKQMEDTSQVHDLA